MGSDVDQICHDVKDLVGYAAHKRRLQAVDSLGDDASAC
jgi:hypothetical protein